MSVFCVQIPTCQYWFFGWIGHNCKRQYMSTENRYVEKDEGYELNFFFGPNINKCPTAELLSLDSNVKVRFDSTTC